MNFICQPCCDQLHFACPGGTYCDCQHREPGQGNCHHASADTFCTVPSCEICPHEMEN